MRPVWADVDHKNLRHNFREIQKLLPRGTGILAVVKANAYGHGLVPVAQTLSRLGARFLGVTSIEESLELKKARIKTPALILGNIYPFSNLKHAIKNNVRVTVASLESARQCAEFARKLRKKVYAHAKIDTGMGRIGVRPENSVAFIKKILEMKAIALEGIYMHFSSSSEDPAFTKNQFDIFRRILSQLAAEKIRIPFIHCANSGAILQYPDTYLTLVRPGLTLYGVSPLPGTAKADLKPVLSWKSKIVFVKDVPAGTSVSYDHTFITKRPSKIATASFGYADGYRRALSNRGQVLVHGKRAGIVGRITMDMTMLDVTDVPHARVGDEIVLLGSQGEDEISAKALGAWAQTSAYETLCAVSARVPRIHHD